MNLVFAISASPACSCGVKETSTFLLRIGCFFSVMKVLLQLFF